MNNTEQLFDSWLKEQSNQSSAKKKRQSKYKKSFIGLRNYQHLDFQYNPKQCNQEKQCFCDQGLLKNHKFWPFIRQDQHTRRYNSVKIKSENGKFKKEVEITRKTRKIMYASHHDATLFAFYAWILKHNFNNIVKNTPLEKSVIGYRKIPINNDHNKSNIDFANDIYKHIQKSNGYVALCLDIHDFFGTINHTLLKQKLIPFQEGISDENLSIILKPITKYRYIFLEDVEKIFKDDANWLDYNKYNKTIRSNPKLIHKNIYNKGIPQGSPISDILANIYMYEFDKWLCQEVYQHEFGLYYRYSDDIIVIVPEKFAMNLFYNIQEQIKKHGLKISDKKTEALRIDIDNHKLIDVTSSYIKSYYKERETLQYLGFEISINRIAIRSNTIAKLYRKYIPKYSPKRASKKRHSTTRNKHRAKNKPKNNKRRYKFTYEKNYNYQKLAQNKLNSSTIKQLRRTRRRIAKAEKNAKNQLCQKQKTASNANTR